MEQKNIYVLKNKRLPKGAEPIIDNYHELDAHSKARLIADL